MLGIIRSGINVAQHELSLVSNNLANAKTTGFKTSSGRFHDQYSQALDGITPASGMGSNIAKSSRVHSQGALVQTDGALDLSVIGASFLGSFPINLSPLIVVFFSLNFGFLNPFTAA